MRTTRLTFRHPILSNAGWQLWTFSTLKYVLVLTGTVDNYKLTHALDKYIFKLKSYNKNQSTVLENITEGTFEMDQSIKIDWKIECKSKLWYVQKQPKTITNLRNP